MAEPTITTLEEETQLLLERLDVMDLVALGAMLTDDAQSVDEITRGWTRGRAAIEAYMAKLEATVSDVHSRASDLRATSWEDNGLMTFVLRQTYTLNSDQQSLEAPTSILLRRSGDEWKVALIHTLPLT